MSGRYHLNRSPGRRANATLVLIVYLLGVFVFALSGSARGRVQHFDGFGLAVVTGDASLGGQSVRDMPLAPCRRWRSEAGATSQSR